MHISEGVLPWQVLAGGAVLTAAGVAVGLKKLDPDRLPQAAVVSAAFFVASLIPFPGPGASVHLVMNGMVGLVLGWTAFPALLVALLLQAVLFSHGGLTVLGVNTLNMALPGVVCYYLFGRRLAGLRPRAAAARGFAAGVLGVGMGCLMLAGCLVTAGEGFADVAKLVFVAHSPIMLIEGLVTAYAVSFVLKVRPELLGGPAVATTVEEPTHD